ncbi:SMP-30/gluconolactonase/LRE family protein [Marivirga arenosa]|uniref:ATP-binding protein n=1 Tax=Marivirga arenosa TaxID=3059076 RepID=A0AA49GD49_9BACT|nr:ATP-binding protein [Marivirga sp. BKB1-2]WKK78975.2 ATP-binding protein [Marivirga sp. BKB1-2]
MKNTLFILGFALLIFACQPAKKENSEEKEAVEKEVVEKPADPKFVKLWETDTVMTTCESVLYDGEGNRLFVSNINGQPLDKNGEGFISILNLDGSVESLNWATGLNAPKGMGIFDGHLYVTDIDRVVAIDLETGEIAKEFTPEKAEFLNDITTSESAVFISDMSLGLIHKIENGELSTVAEGVKGINGLLSKGDHLMTLDGMGLRSLDLASNKFEMVNESVTGGDGLTVLNDGTYIASRWKGEIYHVAGNKATLLLDTEEASQTADIGLNAEKEIVYVPTFFSNKVVAYQLER